MSDFVWDHPRTWVERAAAKLRAEAELIEQCEDPLNLGRATVRFNNLFADSDAAIAKLTASQKIDRDRCLYIIKLDDDADPQEIRSRFLLEKRRGKRKLPQDNGLTNQEKPIVIYVGSSCATAKRSSTLKSRLGQHLKEAYAGTYALSLGAWASGLSGGVIVEAWQYPSMGEGDKGDRLARAVVLAAEDVLSEELQPMFGRRGIRN